MQREYKRVYKNGIFRYWSLFSWKQCCRCKKVFRRERGYRFLSGPYFNGHGKWYYLCSKCAPTFGVANKLALDGVQIPNKPKYPPPSPPAKK